MLSILQRYNWHGFAIVTSQIAGHDEFSRAVRDRTLEVEEEFKFSILHTIIVREPKDLEELANSEARIMLLYSTKDEARDIMETAEALEITGKNYVWIVTQSVIGSDLLTLTHFPVGMLDNLDRGCFGNFSVPRTIGDEARDIMETAEALEITGKNYVWIVTQSVIGSDLLTLTHFPVGMLGLHFETGNREVQLQIGRALEVFIEGARAFQQQHPHKLSPQLSCQGHGQIRWPHGELFYKSVSLSAGRLWQATAGRRG
ncbi:uncharacterized protein LOC119094214 [Pollicipes pollicipes]|uniref:uncharacterized protein LOC119094214 n=1 Tax=Pollicipes pollicipes TaxID=41117 RepID=UPI001884EB94|nr:uncharacterized protein LOC119094214 [Pollicipes pollicipes]